MPRRYLNNLEVAIFECFRAVTIGNLTRHTVNIETPWAFTPPGLYPTVHVEAERKEDEILIRVYQSV